MKTNKKPLTIIILILVAVFSLFILLSPDKESVKDNNKISEKKENRQLELSQVEEELEQEEEIGIELPKVTGVFISLTDKITCKWTAENAFSYRVSIGTSKGLDDVKSWTYVNDTTLSYTPLNYLKNNKYFCNVIATRSYLESDVVSSSNPVSYP